MTTRRRPDRAHCMQGIVPPYLLTRIAEADRPGFHHAANAARQTLMLDPQVRRGRTQLRLTVEDGDTLVAQVADAPDRVIADAKNTEELPGFVVRTEDSGPSDDTSVNEAFDGLGLTFDLLLDAFARNSIDGAGSRLEATVHYGRDYDNAFWDGERMVFGDGDGEVFLGFTGSLTVIAHELGHGVIQHTAGLVYQDQSGALNESIADVFGVLAEQLSLGQTAAEASWLIGAGIFADAVEGVALRSMFAPGTAYDDDVLGKDPQPAHMRDFIETAEDNGGVHLNSGIPNRAFCAIAIELGGNAWERAGKIWYRALTDGLSPTSTFAAFAQATVAAAEAEFGDDPGVAATVRAGWVGVGVLNDDADA